MLIMLDRDGVLNRDRSNYVKNLDELEIIDGAPAAVARFTRAGYKVAVVTNQGGIGRGLYDWDMLNSIHDRITAEVEAAGGKLDAFYVCPEAPWEATDRRKPGPGMLLEALADFKADPAQTYMIGDAVRDLEAAATAGCPYILVRTGKGAKVEAEGLPETIRPAAILDDLDAVADWLLPRQAE